MNLKQEIFNLISNVFHSSNIIIIYKLTMPIELNAVITSQVCFWNVLWSTPAIEEFVSRLLYTFKKNNVHRRCIGTVHDITYSNICLHNITHISGGTPKAALNRCCIVFIAFPMSIFGIIVDARLIKVSLGTCDIYIFISKKISSNWGNIFLKTNTSHCSILLKRTSFYKRNFRIKTLTSTEFCHVDYNCYNRQW